MTERKSLADIDFTGIWESQIQGFTRMGGSKAEEYWNRRAATYASPARTSTYADELIARMPLQTWYSVLDIGCGNGIMSLPIARRVKSVTALDVSSGMLAILKERKELAGLQNIEIVHRDWETVIPEQNGSLYDIVLASRSMSGANIVDSLQKIDKLAKVGCYLTWRVRSDNAFDTEIARILGKEYWILPEYPVILNILYNMGIKANLAMFESVHEERYDSIEEAAWNLARGQTLNEDKNRELDAFIRKYFSVKNGEYYHRIRIPWALISWKKHHETSTTGL